MYAYTCFECQKAKVITTVYLGTECEMRGIRCKHCGCKKMTLDNVRSMSFFERLKFVCFG